MAVVVEKELTPEILLEEMEKIRAQDPDKCLKPKDVVEAARPRSSPLHHRFEWNDKAAGEAYRLVQAGQLISHVEILVRLRGPAIKNVLVKTYHYLPADRKVGRGYRHHDDIAHSRDHLAELRAEMLSELSNLRKRYNPYFSQECGRIEALLAELEA